MSTEKRKDPNLRRLLNRPMCILCARPAEAEEIADYLGFKEQISGSEIAKVDKGHTFWLGSFKLQDGSELECYVTHSRRQGVQWFTADASMLLHILNPRFVVHAGVCAGYRDPHGKIKLKDIIFAESALNYEEGKVQLLENGVVGFQPDFNTVRIPAGKMQAFAESPKRQNYHFGDFLTGSAVRGDASAIFERVKETLSRKAIGLDMEAAAFLNLFQNDYFRDITCLGVVKGVSDFGDMNKDKDQESAYYPALHNTAIALKEWITHRIPRIDWEPRYEIEPAAELVPGYFDNFVFLVVQSLDYGLHVTSTSDPKLDIPPNQIKGLLSVMPPNNDPKYLKHSALINDVIKTHNFKYVQIGPTSKQRNLFYKNDYLIDFVRTINELVKHEDHLYQAMVFAKLLSRQPYYVSVDPARPPRAKVCSWEEFEKLVLADDNETSSAQKQDEQLTDTVAQPANGEIPTQSHKNVHGASTEIENVRVSSTDLENHLGHATTLPPQPTPPIKQSTLPNSPIKPDGSQPLKPQRHLTLGVNLNRTQSKSPRKKISFSQISLPKLWKRRSDQQVPTNTMEPALNKDIASEAAQTRNV